MIAECIAEKLKEKGCVVGGPRYFVGGIQQFEVALGDEAQLVFLIPSGKVGWHGMWIDASDPGCIDKLYSEIVVFLNSQLVP